MPLEDLMVFHKLARSLTSSLELENILRAILEQMNRFISADLWALLMLDESRKELYYALTGSGDGSRLKELRVKVGEGLAGWVAEHGQTLIVPQAEDDPRTEDMRRNNGFHFHSAVAIPIRGRRRTHGVLEVFNPDLTRNSDYTIAFLHILADYAAIAIENAQDVSRVQQLTITDDVTGLYNARHLYVLLERQIALQRADGSAFSLLFLDLDRFKDVNDRYGHLIGSELLGAYGHRLCTVSRTTDTCFRYGGDEFVVLMPATNPQDAVVASIRLHAEMTKTVFRMRNGLKISIGSSVGLASCPADGKSVHAILGVADKRMYSVKASGRGRVSE